MEETVKTFIELVKIDSPSFYEENIKNYIAETLAEYGINFSEDREGNIHSYIEGDGEPILLCAHLDTVEPGRGISPIIENGIIKSNGDTILGADNKASVAAIITALKQSINNRPIDLVFSVREETDGGINGFDFSKLKSKDGIIADTGAPLGTIVVQAPFIIDFELIIRGKASHSSEPHLGVNALSLMSEVISELQLGRLENDITLNIGMIDGGDAVNTIPRKVSIKGEIRGFNKSYVDSELERILYTAKTTILGTGAKYELNYSTFCTGYELSKESIFLNKVVSGLNKFDISPEFEISFGGSDANIFNAYGINVVNIGDGAVDVHTVRERIAINDLIKLKDLFRAYISAI